MWTGPNGFYKIWSNSTNFDTWNVYFDCFFSDQCVAKDSVKVSKDANVPGSKCRCGSKWYCNSQSATLTGTTNLMNNVTYIWTNQAGAVIGNTLSIQVNAPGQYFFEVINTSNNCTSGRMKLPLWTSINYYF